MYTFNLKDSARGFFRGLFPIRGPGAGPPGMVQGWRVLRRVVPLPGAGARGKIRPNAGRDGMQQRGTAPAMGPEGRKQAAGRAESLNAGNYAIAGKKSLKSAIFRGVKKMQKSENIACNDSAGVVSYPCE